MEKDRGSWVDNDQVNFVHHTYKETLESISGTDLCLIWGLSLHDIYSRLAAVSSLDSDHMM